MSMGEAEGREPLMPLTRATVTVASRVMLPAYVAFFAVVGVNWLVTPRSRLLASPGLDYANDLLTIRAWGGLFLASAAVMVVAMVLHSRVTFRFALMLCFLTLIIWAGILGLAAVYGAASPSSLVWPLFIAAACFASYRSLTIGEK